MVLDCPLCLDSLKVRVVENDHFPSNQLENVVLGICFAPFEKILVDLHKEPTAVHDCQLMHLFELLLTCLLNT